MRLYSEQSQTALVVQELNNSGRCQLSVFNGSPAPAEDIVVATMKLSTAFPQMSEDFFNLLAERIVKRGLSKERLNYAIDHVLDNYTYQRMTIADIISLDKKVDVMSYNEMLNDASKRQATTNDYCPIHLGDEPKPFWIRKTDKTRFNIPDRL